jgi:hypothetical protein
MACSLARSGRLACAGERGENCWSRHFTGAARRQEGEKRLLAAYGAPEVAGVAV